MEENLEQPQNLDLGSNENLGKFKDAQTLPLINEIETAKEAVLQEEMAAAEAMGD